MEAFLTDLFKERFKFDLKIEFRWYEKEEEHFEQEEIYYAPEVKHKTETKEAKASDAGKSSGDAPKKTGEKKQEEKKEDEKPKENKFVPKDGGFRSRSKFVKKKLEEDPDLFYGRLFDGEDVTVTPLSQLSDSFSEEVVYGKILKVEDPKLTKKGDKYIIKFSFTDLTDSISTKVFPPVEDKDEILKFIAPGKCIKMKGVPKYDSFDKEVEMSEIVGIKSIPDFVVKRKDTSTLKRVELHAHTTFSDMDAVIAPDSSTIAIAIAGMRNYLPTEVSDD